MSSPYIFDMAKLKEVPQEAKDKALEVYEKLTVYDWDQKRGFIPNDAETKKKCYYMVNNLIYETSGTDNCVFWRQVKDQIKEL